jgi:hypothetical protein
MNSTDVVTRARHKIIILLLGNIICDSLPLLISNDYVLEITSNGVTSKDLDLYIYCLSNSLQSVRDHDQRQRRNRYTLLEVKCNE